MAKQPYIQFYLGDYIKDTRVLALNVKGGWVDLILNMWDNNPRGELTGTIEDFARIMNCDINEANLVIQTLKQKNIFDYRQLENNHFTIISRKQKKMLKISETRKETGGKGGNPILLNQSKNISLSKNKKKDNLNTEYEYNNEIENNNRELVDSKVSNGKFVFDLKLKLPDEDLESCEMNQFGKTGNNNTAFIKNQWLVFVHERMNDPPEKKMQYKSVKDISKHFINFLRDKHPKVNGTNKGLNGQAPVAEIIADRGFDKI